MLTLVRLPKPCAPGEPAESERRRFYRKSRSPNADGTALWQQFSRRRRSRRLLLEALKRVSDGRCAYCEFGRPWTVEHYWPKADHPEKAFVLSNLLPCCSPCNSRKRDKFPLDPDGQPLMLSPYHAHDDPVKFIGYTQFGTVFPLGNGRVHQRGATTIRILGLDRDGVLDNKRRETWVRFRGVCLAYLKWGAVRDADEIAYMLQSSLHHRGVMRYLIKHDAYVRRALTAAARQHPDVRQALAKRPYAWRQSCLRTARHPRSALPSTQIARDRGENQ